MSGPPEPRVSAVIVSHNTREELLRCLDALRDRVRLPLEVIVVDNASADDSVPALRAAHPGVRILANPTNLGFAAANNRGFAEARAPYLLILNSDAEVRPGAVEALASLLDAQPRVGLAGPRTLYPDGTPQLSFGPALHLASEWRQRRLVHGLARRDPRTLARAVALCAQESSPDWISASCLMARREALAAVGGFDEGFFLYEEDVDLCLRARHAGWEIVFTPAAEVIHHLGRSMERSAERARIEYQRSHLRYYRLHNGAGETSLLRLLLAARSLGSLLGALGPGAERARARRVARAVLGLAARGA